MYIKYIFLIYVLLGCTLAGDPILSSTNNVPATLSYMELAGDNMGPNRTITAKSTTTSSTTAPITSTLTPASSSTPLTTSVPTTPPTVPTTTKPTAPTPTPTPTTPTPSTTASPSQTDVWTITNSTTNITCIMAKMDITLEVYQGNKNETLKANPKTVNAKGVCGKELQTLEIVWLKYNGSSLIFSFIETEKKYFISSLQMNILLNNITVVDTEHFNLYETGKNTSYSCPSYEKDFKLNKTTVKLIMNDIQIEAFRLTNSTTFSSAHHCPNSDVPDIVPLIVGLALAGLVVVVVIGYFIGRRRSQARGYLSM